MIVIVGFGIDTRRLKMTKPNNPKRTGGPRTATGQQVASRNALKSGAYSQAVVLPGEVEQEFQELESQFVADFQPQGIAEAAMVHELAVLTWKKLRLERLEQSSFLAKLNQPIESFEMESVGFRAGVNIEWVFEEPEALSSELYDEYLAYRKLLDELARPNVGSEELKALEKQCPFLYELLTEEAEMLGLTGATPELIFQATVTINEKSKPLFDHILVKVRVHIGHTIWACENKDKILKSIALVKDQRLLRLMLSDKSSRAFDDLSRVFARSLSELRKQQAWRIKHRVIDVTPEGEEQ